jgi:hypothetical protein
MSIAPENHLAGRSGKTLDIALIVANAGGLALYLVLASRGWRIPQEHGVIPIAGEPFVWVLALPVLGAFALVNIVWGALLLRCRDPKRGMLWLLTVGVWILTICLDYAHH